MAKIGKNVKFRRDQIESIEREMQAEMASNPDIDFSKWVRRAVDRLLQSKTAKSPPEYPANKKPPKRKTKSKCQTSTTDSSVKFLRCLPFALALSFSSFC
jgi:hypothetical protein